MPIVKIENNKKTVCFANYAGTEKRNAAEQKLIAY